MTRLLLGIITMAYMHALVAGETWVRRLDLSHKEWVGEADIKPIKNAGPNGETVQEWTIQASKPQSLTLDMKEAGIDLNRYDELTCDFYLLGSDASPVWTIEEWPRPKTMSNWYAKMRRPREQWLNFRCDLRMDDDGVFLTPRYAKRKDRPKNPTFTFKFAPRFLRFKGEPSWRKMRVANLRLVKYPVRISFSKRDAEYTKTDTHYITTYTITLTSRMKKPDTATLTADTENMHYHRAVFEGTGKNNISVQLGPGEKKNVKLNFSIEKRKAEMLPPLFAEYVSLSATMKTVKDVTVRPIMGYRDWYLWAAVPAYNMRHPKPAETMAFYREMDKVYPGAAKLSERIVKNARPLLKKDYDVLTLGPTGHDQSYLCKKCQTRPKAIDVQHHQCPKCKTVYTSDIIVKAYLRRRHGEYMGDIGKLAAAYQHSGDEAFANKAKGVLLQYAEKYDKIISQEPRSTASQSKMCSTTLGEAFAVSNVFKAYHKIAASPSLTEAERRKIEYAFLLNSGTRLMSHGAEMNQRAEYFKCFGSAGLYTKRWALAGEAIYGTHGFLSLFDDGFSEDGIAQEGGGYHRSTMHVMCDFARMMNEQGINLFNQRFKRIFDGSVAISPTGVSQYGNHYYEMAYKAWRDPRYLPTIVAFRKRLHVHTIEDGVIGLPETAGTLGTSTVLEGTGYLFLRRNAPSGHRCLAINFGMQWERSEKDRLHTHLYVNGKRISRQVGRITYGSSFSKNMYHSFAHNLVTVDGKDMLEERVPLVELKEEGLVAAALFRTNDKEPLYPGVIQQRLVAIVGDHFFVADVLRSKESHKYAWHYFPTSKRQEVQLELQPLKKAPILSVAKPAPKTFGTCSTAQTDQPFVVKYGTDKEPKVTLFIQTDGKANVLDGEMMQHYYPRMHPFLRVTRDGTKDASFAAVYWTGKGPAKTLTVLEPIKTDPGVHLWRVRTRNTSVLIGIDAAGKLALRVGAEITSHYSGQTYQPTRRLLPH